MRLDTVPMNRFEISTLRAYYGALITEKQNEWLRLHYDEDISLGEIAQLYSVSRQAVLDGIVRNGAVYFAAVGGAGAILSKCIRASQVIAYEDLGTEAIRRLEVENFPVIVVADSQGANLYETELLKYRQD